MEEWKEYKLGDISKDKGCYGIAASAVPYNPMLNTYLRITDINDDGTLNKAGLMSVDEDNAEKYLLKPNDIVFARTGNSTGRTYFYDGTDGEFVYAGFLIKYSLDEKKVNPRILKYYTHSKPYYDWVQSFDTGGTRGNINAKTYADMPLLLPPRPIQDRIVTILKGLDDKIECNRRINENLEQQAQAMFKSWFVDFEPFKDQPFVESELGMIPQGWKVGSFIDLINVMPGGTPSTGVSEYWENAKIPFFSPKDANGVYCFDTEKHISEIGLNNCSSHLYPKDTLFITARGTVGKIVLAAVPMAMNQSNYALVGKEGIGKFYLYLLTQTIVTILLKKANGAVFSAITTKDFKEDIVCPPLGVISIFENKVKPMFDKIHFLMNESRRLAELRDALLPKLMSGEINVDDVTF